MFEALKVHRTELVHADPKFEGVEMREATWELLAVAGARRAGLGLESRAVSRCSAPPRRSDVWVSVWNEELQGRTHSETLAIRNVQPLAG